METYDGSVRLYPSWHFGGFPRARSALGFRHIHINHRVDDCGWLPVGDRRWCDAGAGWPHGDGHIAADSHFRLWLPHGCFVAGHGFFDRDYEGRDRGRRGARHFV